MIFIYTLLDPRTGDIRYVGRTNNLQKRLAGHLRARDDSHRSRWIRLLLREGLKPLMVVQDRCSEQLCRALEAAYTDYFESLGYSLTNGTPGGDGLGTGSEHPFFGKRHSLEHRAAISAGHKGKKYSPERCQAMSQLRKGSKLSPEHVAAIGESKI